MDNFTSIILALKEQFTLTDVIFMTASVGRILNIVADSTYNPIEMYRMTSATSTRY